LKRMTAQAAAAPGAQAGTRAEDANRIKQLQQERDDLKQQLDASARELKSVRAASAKSTAATAKAEESKRIKGLEQERDDLRKRLDASERELKSVRAELAAAPAASAKVEESKRNKKLEQERDDLKQQLDVSQRDLKAARAVASAKTPPAANAEDSMRAKKLEQERDDLRKQLEAATKELNSRRSKTAAARVVEMEQQVAALRARLEVFEARQVPYTAEELALFRQTEVKPVQAEAKAAPKASKELAPGTVALAVEAKRYFAARQYDKAEDKYKQVLREDQNHVPTLVNLAAVEMGLNQLPAAETNIQQALALAPDDPNCLLILGQLRFRQAQYDASLDALSRAAKQDQRNSEIQNALGLTLSAKGLRGPAETALRKAIQLEPGYAEAHNNLAVIYATQKPPLLELARWHYQRALDGGGRANPDLEKMLASKPAGEGAK
jgi:Flp pilus assembly protein TadD